MDVTSESQVQNGYESICDQFKSKRVDVLIANAGIQHISPFEDFSLEDWQKMVCHYSFLLKFGKLVLFI